VRAKLTRLCGFVWHAGARGRAAQLQCSAARSAAGQVVAFECFPLVAVRETARRTSALRTAAPWNLVIEEDLFGRFVLFIGNSLFK